MSNTKFSMCLDLRKRREKTIVSLREEDLLVADTERLLQTLKKECVDLNSWFYIILFYYSKGDYTNFKKFSDELVNIDVNTNPFYKDQKQLFMYILHVLSFFYSFIAQRSKEKEKYDTFSTLSTSLVNHVEIFAQSDPMTLILKGFLFFTQGDYANSDIYFTNILDHSLPPKILILAKLGRALIFFNQSNYAKSIECFVSLIKEYNYINENILEGLGICYYNLSKIQKAKEIFEKILQAYPNNTKVKVYLAIIEIYDIDNENFEVSFDHLIEAYQMDEYNLPVLLINLCNILLLAGQTNKAGEICSKLNAQLEYGEMKYISNAINSSKGNEKFKQDLSDIKTAIYVMNAKYQLALKNTKEALAFFLRSAQCNQKNIEAQFGLGQIYLSMQNLSEAEKCFEICKTVLDDSKKISFKVLKYLAYIKSKTKRKEVEKTIEMYKTALSVRQDDIDCHIELAELLNLRNPEESLKYYQTAINLIQNQISNEESNNNNTKANDQDCSNLYTKDILPEVQNNIACILIRLERHLEAEPYLTQAKELIKKEMVNRKDNKKEIIRLQAIKLGIDFNFALYYEKKAQFDYAHMICKKIIQQNPYFIEAYIKLSELSKLRGNKSKANDYIKTAIERHFTEDKSSNSNPEAKDKPIDAKSTAKKLISIINKPINSMIIQAYLHYESGKEQEALQTLSQILKFYDDLDPYTLVFLGNIYYSMAIENRAKGIEKMNRAVELYFHALECDKYNVLAAIGLCNCLAEYNYVDKALEVYKGITEVMENNHNAFVNESLLYMNEKKWEKASIILSKVLKKIFNGKNQIIENLLCKCYIETKDFIKANHLIKNIMMKYPENFIYKFNYGILLIAKSNEILSKTERRVSETKEAISLIEKAIKLFETISSRKDFSYKCNEMLALWKLNLGTANNSLEKDKDREEEMNKKIEMNIMEYNKMIEAQNEKIKETELDREENEKLYRQNRELAESMIKLVVVDPNKPVKRKRQKVAEDAFVDKEERNEENKGENDEERKHTRRHKHKHKHSHKHKHRRHKRERSEEEEDDNKDKDKDKTQSIKSNDDNANEENRDNSDDDIKKGRKKKKKLHKKRDYEEDDDGEDPFALPEGEGDQGQEQGEGEDQQQQQPNEKGQDKEPELEQEPKIEVDPPEEKVQ